MRLLLDTHIFLWYISGDGRLRDSIRDAISDSQNQVYLSVISLWESLVKHALGQLPLPAGPEQYLPTQRERHLITSLPLDEGSVAHLPTLPSIHRDPFDRILICQALEHGKTIVTVDDAICAYTNNVLR
jgi:PIN domain nuclease of toxin-antitoxin system